MALIFAYEARVYESAKQAFVLFNGHHAHQVSVERSAWDLLQLADCFGHCYDRVHRCFDLWFSYHPFTLSENECSERVNGWTLARLEGRLPGAFKSLYLPFTRTDYAVTCQLGKFYFHHTLKTAVNIGNYA